MDKDIETLVQEAKNFCRYELLLPDFLKNTKEATYLQEVFDRVYLCAVQLKDPKLPFSFYNDMCLFAHDHSPTLREHVQRIRNSPESILEWEKIVVDAIEKLDESRQNEDYRRFFDISTEELKNIHCQMK